MTEPDLSKLRALEHTAPPRRRRSPWLFAVLVALELALVAFAVIGPTQVPPQLVGVFSDRPVSELSLKGGSWVEVELTRPDPHGWQTSEVAEVFRDRGAAVAFEGAGKLILEIPELHEDKAREWAETITSSGSFELAIVEEVTEGPAPAAGAPQRWVRGESQSYRLGQVILDASAIADARVEVNPRTTRPEVLIELSPEAGGRFEAFTQEHIGEELAIVFGGEVISAPKIASAISGGRISISTGAPPEIAWAEAEAIAAILVGDPLPAEVKIGHVESVYSIAGSGAVWAGRALLAGLLGLVGFAIAAPFRRRLGLPDPDVAPLRGGGASRRPLAGRIALTALGAAIVGAIAHVALPGNAVAIKLLDNTLWASWAAIGVLPFLIGAVIAGFVARRFPRRRRWLELGTGLGLLGLALWLWARVGVLELETGSPLIEHGSLGLALAALGGTSLGLYGLARLIDRVGVGSGFAAVLAGLFLPSALRSLSTLGDYDGESAALYLLGLFAIAVTTAFLLRTRVRGRDGGRVPLVGAGIAPLLVVSVVGPFVLDGWWSGSQLWLLVSAALVLGLGAALTVALLRPRTGSGPRVVSEKSGFGLATSAAVAVASLGYLGGLLLFEAHYPPLVLLSAAGFAIATAAALDVVADVRARWRNPELVRVAAIDDRRAGDSIASALATAGIDCHVRNRHLRWLTGAAGAWVPLEIWTPGHRAGEAAAIIDGQL